MANSTGEDHSKIILMQYFLRSAGAGILILAGLVIQLFIVAVNITDWLKGRSITEADKIITSLGVSRILFHLFCLLGLFAVTSLSKSPSIFLILYILIEISTYSGVWLSTLLSTFFYFKISTFHNVFFLRLKAIISKRVTYLILASVLLSLPYSFVNFVATFNELLKNSTQTINADYTKQQIMSNFHVALNIFPILLFFIASALFIILLGFHMSRMNNHGHAMSNTDTYHRTLTFTVFSFLACAFYVINILFQVFMRLLDIFWLCFTINVFPVLHSLLLIYVMTKLRNQFFMIVRCRINCLL
uniref:Taste receptor type 2 n=1 Tax=Pyxicephalus adspersus TaxID=30357 RepID=A0AAV3AEX0_PYXAD|nr:TPA: hypothetical protein GDO54_009893 [Pyxicephalus adspersus]